MLICKIQSHSLYQSYAVITRNEAISSLRLAPMHNVYALAARLLRSLQ